MASSSSGGREFAALLRTAGKSIVGDVVPIMDKGSLEIKKTLVSDARASTHFKGVADHISYETTETATRVSAEIGPHKIRGGKLANIAYFGGTGYGGKHSGGTLPDPELALQKELPALEMHLAAAVVKAFE